MRSPAPARPPAAAAAPAGAALRLLGVLVVSLLCVGQGSDNPCDLDEADQPDELCIINVGFLALNLGNGDKYYSGFRFWVYFVNKNFGSSAKGLWRDGDPCCARAHAEAAVPGLTQDEIEEGLVERWDSADVEVAIIGYPLASARTYSAALSRRGINHIAANGNEYEVFQNLQSDVLWGVLSDGYVAAASFLTVVSRSSQYGYCTLLQDENQYGERLIEASIELAEDQGMELMYSGLFVDSDDESALRASLQDFVSMVNETKCDVLLLEMHSTPAMILQELVAEAKLELVAELFLDLPDLSDWSDLEEKGAQVFGVTQWHQTMDHECPVFDNTEGFVDEFLKWAGKDSVPEVGEAAATAAGVIIQAALDNSKWFPTDVDDRITLFEEISDLPAYQHMDLMSFVDDEAVIDDHDMRRLVWHYRLRKALQSLSTTIFFGHIHFDATGMNVKIEFALLQFFQTEDGHILEKTVRPISAETPVPIVPMTSFQAREGCPAGTYKKSGPTVGNWTRSGDSCESCEKLTYQDDFNQASCKPCPLGEYSEAGATSCTDCDVGFYRGESEDECTACDTGYFSNSSGASSCHFCPIGRYAGQEESSSCDICPPGFIAPEEGLRECQACEPGYSTRGQSESSICWPCNWGFFADEEGSPSCQQCPATFNTTSIASDSEEDCVCPAETYLHRDSVDSLNESCQTGYCGNGLKCPGGTKDPPLTDVGYSAGVQPFDGGEPAYVVKCASDEDCPGDLALGECPDGREAVACAECKDGYSRVSGECVKCESTPLVIPLVVTFLIIIVAILFLYGLRLQDTVVEAEAIIKITAVMGVMLTAIQILAVLRHIKLDWPDPIATLHDWYTVLVEPIKLLNLKCTLSVSKPLHTYLSIIVVWPAFALFVFLGFKLAACLPGGFARKVSNTQIFHIEGLVVLMFYTSISMYALLPWQCEENPDKSLSVVAYRQVYCFNSREHTWMIIVSLFAILTFVIGFMSLIIWATYQYPIKVTRSNGIKFLLRFKWIFNRYAPDRYWWGLVYCARNLLVALLPVLFVNHTALQLLLVASAMLLSLLFQCWVRPWKTELANKFDSAVTVLLILILVSGSLLLNPDGEQVVSVVRVFFSIGFSVLGAITAGIVGFYIHKRMTMRKQFGYFLCHHKDGAAVLARWMKIELKLRQKEDVFLDSDALDRLDTLFEFVAYQTQNLVVLLTKETLRRIWCAGEIATALEREVNIIAVVCNDYEEPSDEFISNLSKIWSDRQLTEVARQGVSLEQIQLAFRQFREIPKIKLDRTLDFKEQEKVIDELLRLSRGIGVKGSSRALPTFTTKAGLELATPPNNSALSGVTPAGADPKNSTLAGAIPGSLDPNNPSPSGILATVSGFGATPSGTVKAHRRPSRLLNLLIGDLSDPESTVVCRVIQLQLQQVMQTHIQVGSSDIVEALEQLRVLEQPSHLVTVLSRGVLARLEFAVVVARADAMEERPILIPIVADYGFTFPDVKFWEDLEDGLIIAPEELSDFRVTLHDVVRAYKSLFTVITKRFSSHGSENIQMTEVREIASLFQNVKMTGTDRSSDRSSRTLPRAVSSIISRRSHTPAAGAGADAGGGGAEHGGGARAQPPSDPPTSPTPPRVVPDLPLSPKEGQEADGRAVARLEAAVEVAVDGRGGRMGYTSP